MAFLTNGVGTGKLLPEHNHESDDEAFAAKRSQRPWLEHRTPWVVTYRLPGVRVSFQVTPSVAFNSSSIDALISAISWITSGLSGVLHLT